MQLYNVSAWANAEHGRDDKPEWETTLAVENVEDAYNRGLALFRTERPELAHENYIIEASY